MLRNGRIVTCVNSRAAELQSDGASAATARTAYSGICLERMRRARREQQFLCRGIKRSIAIGAAVQIFSKRIGFFVEVAINRCAVCRRIMDSYIQFFGDYRSHLITPNLNIYPRRCPCLR